MAAEYENSNFINILDILQIFEGDIDESELSVLFDTSRRLTQELINETVEYNDKSKECLKKISEETLKFEQLAKTAKRELDKKFIKQVESLNDNRIIIEKELHNKESALNDLTNKMQQLEKDQHVLSERSKNVAKKEHDDVGKDQAIFNLYTNTFRIKWDFTCDEKTEAQGCFTGAKMTLFKIDKKECSRSQNADKLWNLIENSK